MVDYGILVARDGAGPFLETDVQKILLANVDAHPLRGSQPSWTLLPMLHVYLHNGYLLISACRLVGELEDACAEGSGTHQG